MDKFNYHEFTAPISSGFAKTYPDLSAALICIGKGIINNGKFSGKMWNKNYGKIPPKPNIESENPDCAWYYAIDGGDNGEYVEITVISLEVENIVQ